MMGSDNGFNGVTVFITAYKETFALSQTIEKISEACSPEDIYKIYIVLKSDECPAFFEAEKIIERSRNEKIELYVQKSHNLILCFSELPVLVKSSHFVIMTADMEMNPANIADFICGVKENPFEIICATKWNKESIVEGYGFIHKLCSRTINRLASLIINKDFNDLFSIFQIYPIAVYNKMNFNNPSRFMYEYTLKPVYMGVGYREIPTVYNKRSDGNSNFKVLYLVKVALVFLHTAIRIRLNRKENNNEY